MSTTLLAAALKVSDKDLSQPYLENREGIVYGSDYMDQTSRKGLVNMTANIMLPLYKFMMQPHLECL